MFMGEYHHTIDTKGRLIVPAKFREALGPKFIVTRGMDGCLFGYAVTEWELLEQKLRQLPLTKRDARAFVRFLYSAATECVVDKQGRINLPELLRQHAGLEKACVLLGVSNRIEIWDQSRWEKASAEAAENFDDIAENMLDIDF
ncbi:division/cell wall cluster transcriptional repressor MraZ [Loigolactobacillus bifermentans]|jgi:MraZ protein|uniref:Transcriptional regulator MraZ n=1 Tax=Loigolactobacillus bifermentans DSM 20003 TaxID=1423726 RepID=A0A0R1HA27_9LACO|nr:division/cell wall cluster transcriptional repressor MraZ [Loigolactobacillus bifermentans]KRK40458.1 cell division protein MraZ [Loigolactobacillus bifermentans DSM 20003]QGG59818.1 division/cell wall cluster transcriptional repressor MraZ [Loigolactobacillus bifermentans]